MQGLARGGVGWGAVAGVAGWGSAGGGGPGAPAPNPPTCHTPLLLTLSYGSMIHLLPTRLHLVPFGLRNDALGLVGRTVAHLANRCALGTTLMQAIRRRSAPLPESAADA